MELVEKKCLFYKYNDEYSIEIMEEVTPSGEEMWESWLVKKDYGFKSSTVGIFKKDIPTVDEYLEIVLNDIDLYIESYEEELMLVESDPDIVLNRPVCDMFNELLDRTIENCQFYEKENRKKNLLNEAGCLRGITYAIDKVGELPARKEIFYYLDKARELTDKGTAPM